MTNSSDAIMASLRSVYASLDTLGSTGFAYAFQDKIVPLYETDEYVARIVAKIKSLRQYFNPYIASVFDNNPMG
jgi:hypothetical protein